ncbi:MAG TPA: response regulator [Candidatus Dormibacteraeota bacterium]|nr:response regulator [Candidatus Dormibacteraeota bacterium]
MKDMEGDMANDEIEPVRVLLVEDDREFAQMYQLKLEADGYDVTHARDGEEGLRLATELRPDLIFLDVRMPRMNGLELLQELRKRDETRETPVVILSNYGEDELRQQGLALGILEWLIKADVTPGQVSRRIELWSRGSSSPEPASSEG